VGPGDPAEPLGRGAKQAVVRPDQPVTARHLEGDRTPLGPDAGIHDREVHADRLVRQRRPQQERPVAHAEGSGSVGEVVDPGLRQDRPDHAPAGGRRGVAEVGEEADERWRRHGHPREIRTGRS
jgi:hypothetical protein